MLPAPSPMLFSRGIMGLPLELTPVAAAAGLATLKVLIEENYPQKAAFMGAYLMEQLHQLQKKYPQAIAEIRGKGLMIGMELKIDGKAVLQACHSQGLLANITAGNVLRFLPPYTITKEDINKAVSIVERAIKGAK